MSLSFITDQVYRVVGEAANLVQSGLTGETKRQVNLAPGGSHHSLLTQLDLDSQALVVRELRGLFPQLWYLAEENCPGDQVITDKHLERLFEADTSVCVVDGLDGTASAARQRWDWSACAHVVCNNTYFGGAIVAPDVRGGFHVVAEAGRGAFMQEGSQVCQATRLTPTTVSKISSLREATVLFGVDLPKRVQFSQFLMETANSAQTCAMGGSCALGVASVVAGRAEALVQTQQWPWDWVSAFMVKEAGGKVIWFHYRRGTLLQLKEPDRLSYSRNDRGKHGGLGFIAGNPQVVDRLWAILRESWAPG